MVLAGSTKYPLYVCMRSVGCLQAVRPMHLKDTPGTLTHRQPLGCGSWCHYALSSFRIQANSQARRPVRSGQHPPRPPLQGSFGHSTEWSRSIRAAPCTTWTHPWLVHSGREPESAFTRPGELPRKSSLDMPLSTSYNQTTGTLPRVGWRVSYAQMPSRARSR